MLLTESIVPVEQLHIKPQHCVNNRIQGSRCRTCVTICPRQSIRLTNSGRYAAIEVNDTCSGCGLCAAACPAGAIGTRCRLPEKFKVKDNTVELACRKQQIDGAFDCLGMLDAYSLSYIGLQSGQLSIVLDSHRCAACNPGVPAAVRQVVSSANVFLGKFGRPAINVILLRGKAEAVIGRRDLFAFCFSRARETLLAALPLSLQSEETPRQGLVRLIARKITEVKLASFDAAPLFWGARMKSECNFCGICARACKQAALILAADRKEQQLVLWHNQSKCIGCKACQMLCPHKCLELKTEFSNTNLVGSSLPAAISSSHCCRVCGTFLPAREQACSICSPDKNPFLQAIY